MIVVLFNLRFSERIGIDEARHSLDRDRRHYGSGYDLLKRCSIFVSRKETSDQKQSCFL